jgi:hypothetical protein
VNEQQFNLRAQSADDRFGSCADSQQGNGNRRPVSDFAFPTQLGVIVAAAIGFALWLEN